MRRIGSFKVRSPDCASGFHDYCPPEWARCGCPHHVKAQTDGVAIQWATITDAAAGTGLRPALVRRWAARGVVAADRSARPILVSLADVRRAERDLRTSGPRPGRARQLPAAY